MAKDLAPAPIQAPVVSESGIATPVWADWFRGLSGESDKSASGYQKLPGGITIQWGVTGSVGSAATSAISFPVAFDTECLQVISGVRDNNAVATAATGQWGTGGYSASGFSLYNRTSVALTFNWLAIGH